LLNVHILDLISYISCVVISGNLLHLTGILEEMASEFQPLFIT